MHRTSSARKGFTLIELLLVIGIIAILAAIVIVAINPTKQLGDARDAQRRSDVNTLLNAIWQYAIDNGGNLPCQSGATTPCIDASWRMLGTATSGCDSTAATYCPDTAVARVGACLDLTTNLKDKYIVNVPHDPRYGSGAFTHYIVSTAAGNGRVTVTACNAEQATVKPISVTR